MTLYDELIARGLIAQVTNEEEIKNMINNGKATFYIGFDCTADSLHVGHFMALCLMKRLQMAGNKPIALIGDGTTLIGDPSGRTDMRQMLTEETIKHNAECFKRQMERFIDFSDGKALMLYNSEWLKPLNYIELLREVGACFSVNNMLRAECYKQRMEKGLSFLEFNYMIMQSYDFYYMFQHYGCNMQFGGNDQWSNMLGGTELIRKKLGKDAHAMTITLLLNSEGKKMGKTAKGAVWLDPNKTSPFEFFQYWRNVDDADVLKCIRMLTFLPLEQIDEMADWKGEKLNEAKEILAFELTKLVHSEAEAEKAPYLSAGYVPTSVSEDVYKAIQYCQLERGIVVLHGDAGIGKTRGAARFVQDNPANAIYIRCTPVGGTLTAMLRQLGTALKLPATRNRLELSMAIHDRLKGTDKVIIIDEAQNLRFDALEELRSLSDPDDLTGESGTGICLIGNSEVYSRMLGKQEAQFAQQFSRVRFRRRYSTADVKLADVEKLFPTLADGSHGKELAFMTGVCRSKWGIRGAMSVYTNAVRNENTSLDGLRGIAASMGVGVLS